MSENKIKNTTNSALIVIDMENAFISEKSPFCIKMAMKSVPVLEKTIKAARSSGIPVFFVKRIYRSNGSDVESVRYETFKNSTFPMNEGDFSACVPDGLKPQSGDYTIIKSRWSAFFMTELDLILRRLGIRNVILTGTTTPNCVRTTAYDASSLDYNVFVIEDCCSSQTQEIQDANIEDIKRMGAIILKSEEFIKNYKNFNFRDLAFEIKKNIEEENIPPENFLQNENSVQKIDKW